MTWADIALTSDDLWIFVSAVAISVDTVSEEHARGEMKRRHRLREGVLEGDTRGLDSCCGDATEVQHSLTSARSNSMRLKVATVAWSRGIELDTASSLVELCTVG
jgi:hypothetical protein